MTAPLRPQIAQDFRFKDLMNPQDWAQLPLAVKRRFTQHLSAGQSVTYIGQITQFRRTRLGLALSQALRLIGAPLPLCPRIGMASVVSVTEDAAGMGQNWTRLYANPDGFPQVIHSAKRFGGPTGLIEHLGRGIAMRLALKAENGALLFQSVGYTLTIAGRSIPLPKLLSPGNVTVRHKDLGHGRFEFSFTLTHPIFGELIHQAAEYREERQ